MNVPVWVELSVIAALILSGVALWLGLRHSSGHQPDRGSDAGISRRDLDALEVRLSQRNAEILQIMQGYHSILRWVTLSNGAEAWAEDEKRAGQESGEQQREAATVTAAEARSARGQGPDKATGRLSKEESSFSSELKEVLLTREFLDGLWPDLLNDFNTASQALTDFLRGREVSAFDLDPYPPLREDDANHWEFLVVRPRVRGPEGGAFLIPRSYGRYDPFYHEHLFKVEGPNQSSDTFFRQLLRPAQLRSTERPIGPIPAEQVLEPGRIRLDPPRR